MIRETFTFTSIIHHHYEDNDDYDFNYFQPLHCICGKDKEKEMVANKGSSCSGPVLLDLLFA